MVIGEEPPEAVSPPGFEITVKTVTGKPPLPPSVNAIVAWPFPRVAELIVGASGTVAGITALLAVDVALVPTSLVAVIVKV